MGTKFVVNYINLVDGEQDPRNLMLIFNMTVMVLQHFDIGLFDIGLHIVYIVYLYIYVIYYIRL